MTRKIITSRICPPIPQHSSTGIKLWYAWQAYYNDDVERGSGWYGEGDSESEAVADLHRLYGEEAEAQEAEERAEIDYESMRPPSQIFRRG